MYKGKYILEQATSAPRGEKISYSFTLPFISALDWEWVVNATPRLSLPRKRHPISILQEAKVGPQGLCGRVWKISPLMGFNPRTSQPVASRYPTELFRSNVTDCEKSKLRSEVEFNSMNFVSNVIKNLSRHLNMSTGCCLAFICMHFSLCTSVKQFVIKIFNSYVKLMHLSWA